MKNTKATIIGIPLDLGAENLGVDIGPDAFRYQHLKEKLQSAGLEMSDAGNIQTIQRDRLEIGNPKLKYLHEIVRVSEEAAKQTYDFIKQGQKIVGLGGDHSIALGVISGASVAMNGELGLIYIDAHGDMNTEKTTLTGNIHGMHLSSLMGFGAKELTDVFGKTTKIKKQNMLHIGGNDWDESELELIKKEQLQCYTMVDFLSHGLGPLFGFITDLSSRVKNIWVSLDLDAIDSMYAPGVGMPNKAGFTYREIMAITDYIGKSCHVIGVDIDEYNPLTDQEGKTAELSIELIAKLFGLNYSWYTHYMEQNKIR